MDKKFHFTKKLLAELPPLPKGMKQFEWIDATEPALRVVQYRDCISFIVRTCADGQRRCETVGEFPYDTITKMRELATEKRVLAKRGGLSAKDSIKFEQFCNEIFLKPLFLTLKDGGAKYLQLLRDFIYPVIGNRPLRKVSRRAIEMIKSEMVDNGYSKATADHVIKLIKQVLECAVDHDYLIKSPARGVKLFNPKKKRTRVLSRDESRRLLMVCEHEQTLVADYISVLQFLPIRKGECSAIKIEHISSDLKSIMIPDNKSDRPYWVYVPDLLVPVIKRRVEQSHNEYLFPSPVSGREGHHVVDLTAGARNLYAKAGLKDIIFHDFRRTGITNMTEVVGAHAASRAANHADLAITSRYYQTRDTAMADAFERTAQYVFQ
jgi:integrase